MCSTLSLHHIQSILTDTPRAQLMRACRLGHVCGGPGVPCVLVANLAALKRIDIRTSRNRQPAGRTDPPFPPESHVNRGMRP